MQETDLCPLDDPTITWIPITNFRLPNCKGVFVWELPANKYEISSCLRYVKMLPYSVYRAGAVVTRKNGKVFNRKADILNKKLTLLKQKINNGYIYFCLNGFDIIKKKNVGRTVGLHQLIAQIFKLDGYEKYLKDPKEYTVDHFPDRNTLNNSKENLRFASKSEQKHNTALQKDNKSGYKGVISPRKARYEDGFSYMIQCLRMTYASGEAPNEPRTFPTAKEAAIARDLRIIELENQGKQSRYTPLNFPELRIEHPFVESKLQPHNKGKKVGGIKADKELCAKRQRELRRARKAGTPINPKGKKLKNTNLQQVFCYAN